MLMRFSLWTGALMVPQSRQRSGSEALVALSNSRKTAHVYCRLYIILLSMMHHSLHMRFVSSSVISAATGVAWAALHDLS